MRYKNNPQITKATFTKRELMQYLEIGDKKFKELMQDPSFPKKKPILDKWSIAEIDTWLKPQNNIEAEKVESITSIYLG